MTLASAASRVKPFKRIILLMASSQPSGVVRIHEIRLRLPLSSFVWQLEHLLIVTASVTGIPGSSAAVAPAPPPRPPPPRPPPLPCARAAGAVKNTPAIAAIAAKFLIIGFLVLDRK